MFEVFEHTADLGLRIQAADLPSLFAEGARALFSVIVSNPEAIEPCDSLTVAVAGSNLEYLFVDWLDELLFLYESKRFLAATFDVAIEADGLSATVRGEPCDLERHVLAHEVKAITYHGLRVEKNDDAWLAEVILDI
jgi:SHS2 domain-containing protein